MRGKYLEYFNYDYRENAWRQCRDARAQPLRITDSNPISVPFADVYSIKEKYCPDSTQPSPSRVMVNPKSYPGLTKKTKTLKAKTQSHFGSKSKRVRTIFTPEQLERLETEFERQQYMVGTGRLYLASTLNLTEAQVKVWFQNRRIKWRKQHLEGQADKDSILERDFDV